VFTDAAEAVAALDDFGVPRRTLYQPRRRSVSDDAIIVPSTSSSRGAISP
jgi:hypothetical protein